MGKNLENESLILTSNFEVFPSSNLKKPQILRWGWGWHFDPQCKNSDLILASKFEVFWGWDIFKKHQYFALFFKEFLEKNPIFALFFEVFRGILEKPQNYSPHPHLKHWGFLRFEGQKPQKFYVTLILKNPRSLSKLNPQPQKTSNFEAEAEDPRILRSKLPTLPPLPFRGPTLPSPRGLRRLWMVP